MSKHSVSVIIPCHAQEHLLFRALSSVIWQLRPGDEVIVIHDSDKRLDTAAIRPFKKQVTVLENRARKGVSFSRNRGIRHAKNYWIKFLDADDVLCPFALDIVRGKIKLRPEVRVITGGAHCVSDGEYTRYMCADKQTFMEFDAFNPTLPSLTFVRRDALLKLGLFNEQIDHEEDWDLWFRVRERYGYEAFQVVFQPVCFYSSNHDEREKKRKKRRAVVDGKPVRDYFRERYGADPAPLD